MRETIVVLVAVTISGCGSLSVTRGANRMNMDEREDGRIHEGMINTRVQKYRGTSLVRKMPVANSPLRILLYSSTSIFIHVMLCSCFNIKSLN